MTSLPKDLQAKAEPFAAMRWRDEEVEFLNRQRDYISSSIDRLVNWVRQEYEKAPPHTSTFTEALEEAYERGRSDRELEIINLLEDQATVYKDAAKFYRDSVPILEEDGLDDRVECYLVEADKNDRVTIALGIMVRHLREMETQ